MLGDLEKKLWIKMTPYVSLEDTSFKCVILNFHEEELLEEILPLILIGDVCFF